MKLWQALMLATEERKKIRLRRWTKESYLYIDPDGYLRDQDDDLYDIDYEEFKSDWEFYEGEEPLQTRLQKKIDRVIHLQEEIGSVLREDIRIELDKLRLDLIDIREDIKEESP